MVNAGVRAGAVAGVRAEVRAGVDAGGFAISRCMHTIRQFQAHQNYNAISFNFISFCICALLLLLLHVLLRILLRVKL